jgi:ankyrin repeat protein
MPDLVEYLIVNGASVNITDRYNYTPLITAMMYKVTSNITKALVLNGSNLDGPKVVSSYQNSPLFWASKYKDFEMMRLILLAGVPMWLIRCVKHALQDATGRNAAAIGYLDEYTRNAPSLKQMCRRIFRTTVSESCKGKHFGQKIDSLPLPQILKSYLLLQ